MAEEVVNTNPVPPSVTPQPPAETPAPPVPASATPPVNAEPQQTPVSPAVFSQTELDAYTNEFYQSGTLSEASFEAIAKKGIPREVVQDYIAGQKSRVAQETEELTKGIGGYAQFQKVAEWAGKNLSEAERASYNEVFKSGNKTAIQAVLEKMNNLYLNANPQPPPAQINGNPATSAAVPTDVFASRDEMVQAMMDTRYQKGDAAYIRSVQEKVQRSMNAGISLR